MSPKSAVASKVAKPLDNNTPTNTPANKVAMDVDEPAVTPAPKQRGLMAAPGTLGTSAKKTKTGAKKADNSKAHATPPWTKRTWSNPITTTLGVSPSNPNPSTSM
ncbi:hypothetical protein RHS01_10830 [Rhizoctonia solani]|uniref:Uncharacterized protein n=1 Tax=Rhizoctonia solani TaxID=456999 RepID=A0A8H7I4J7_9AGAM|nr:hypothetical protein RHS01_10830 [Rhizoctonia solani]